MGTMINRRRACGGKKDRLTLIHHWEASDGIVNGGWVDRIQGKVLTAYGNPQLVNGMFKVRGSYTYFRGDLNDNIPVNMGDVWQIDTEFIVNSVPTDNKRLCIEDFGSLAMAEHSFMFSVNVNSEINFNPKLTGNTSVHLYSTPIPFSSYGVLSKASMGMEKIDDTTYLPYYLLNGARYNSPNTIAKTGATFNGNFNRTTLYVGRGFTDDISYYSHDWQYIKSIKIYKKVQA